MQAYFFRMHRLAQGTCGLERIREVAQTVSSLFLDENKENTSVGRWAQQLVFAATAQVAYTRSAAILIAELLDILRATSEPLSADLRPVAA